MLSSDQLTPVTAESLRELIATRDYQGCDILIDESTQRMQSVHPVAEVSALGVATLKGKQNKVAIYSVK